VQGRQTILGREVDVEALSTKLCKYLTEVHFRAGEQLYKVRGLQSSVLRVPSHDAKFVRAYARKCLKHIKEIPLCQTSHNATAHVHWFLENREFGLIINSNRGTYA
jgi:hypothetical protein